MTNARKKNPIPIFDQVGAGGEIPYSHEQVCSQLWALKLQAMPLTLDFDQLLHETKLGRSKAYELMQEKHRNFDPTFPQGVPLYDSERSPKFWWSHLVVAWLMRRDEMKRKFFGES